MAEQPETTNVRSRFSLVETKDQRGPLSIHSDRNHTESVVEVVAALGLPEDAKAAELKHVEEFILTLDEFI